MYPFDPLRASRVAQSPSGEAQPYLPHVTRRVPRCVRAKFHAEWTKTEGARGIHTNRETDRQSYFNNIDVSVVNWFICLKFCQTNAKQRQEVLNVEVELAKMLSGTAADLQCTAINVQQIRLQI